MASRAGLFDYEFYKKSIAEPEINSQGMLDPDFSTTVTITAAQELPAVIEAQVAGSMTGMVYS